MAAGRIGVPRRTDIGKLNRGHALTVPNNDGFDYQFKEKKLVSYHKNGYNLGHRRCGLEASVEIKNNGAKMMTDEQPPQKKRKFSPVVWDIEEKEVRVSSRNRIVSTTTTLSSHPSPCKLSDVVSDGGVKKHPVSSSLIEEVEHLAPKSPSSDSMAEKEIVQAPSVLTSRWSSDSDDEDLSRSKEKVRSSRSSSLESGECERDDLEGDDLNQSDERSSSVFFASKDDDMECRMDSYGVVDSNGVHEDDAVIDQSESDDEQAAGRGMNMLLGCRSVFEYEKLNKISEGTYGIVYRARDKKTGEIVALKKVKILNRRDSEEYGFPLTSLREINILASFDHPSIVKVKEVVVDDHDNVYMVMEYMDHDFKGLIESLKNPFSTSDVKCLMIQLLEGVKYLHDNWVLHRDLKSSNLLLNNQGELKICDFGMARLYGSPLKPYTTKVVTQWYRAPELLLGAKQYSTAVDMWSVGCIMAEMLAKEPLFKGTSEIDQIHKIFDTLGAPSEKIWAGFSELPGAKANYSKQQYNLLRRKFPAASFTGYSVLSDAGFDLLNRLLTYDPKKRITADDALNHEWFHELPLPKSREFLPTFPSKV